MENVEMYSDKLIDFALVYGPKLIGAILVWIIGGMAINMLKNAFDKMLEKHKTDSSLKTKNL